MFKPKFALLVSFALILLYVSSGLYAQSEFKKGWLTGSWSHLTTKDGLSSDAVLSIGIEGNYVWFGTYAGGASCYDKNTNQWTVHTTKWEPAVKKTKPGLYWENSLDDNHVTAIATDANNVMWFGTTFYGYDDNYGISRFIRNSTQKWSVFGVSNGIYCNDITSIAVDPDFVWFGTLKGLARFTKKTGSWTFFNSTQQLSSIYINSVAIDSQDVWLGTGHGITVFNKKTGIWKHYFTKDGLPEETIQAIAVEGNNIWIGGMYGSLAIYNKQDKTFKKITTGDKLDDKWIKTMLYDGKHIWIARDGGISVYNIATSQWLSITSDDGLIDNQVNAIAIDGNTIWFGTGMGVSRLVIGN